LAGVSKYSSDFQAVLNRAVAIAQLPVTQLQNEDATILAQENQLSTLGSSVNDFQTSLAALGTLALFWQRAGRSIFCRRHSARHLEVDLCGTHVEQRYQSGACRGQLGLFGSDGAKYRRHRARELHDQ
jgi:hypothetical protein